MKWSLSIVIGVGALLLVLKSDGLAAVKSKVVSCGPNRHFVKQHKRRAYIQADGKSVPAAVISDHCANNPKGYDVWNSKIKNGRPDSWPRTNEKSQQWTTEEKERVIEAIASLPSELLNTGIRGVFKMERCEELDGNPASKYGDDLVLYDSAFDSDKNLAQIISHELAHQYYEKMLDQDQYGYRQSSGWYDLANPGKPHQYASLRKDSEFTRRNAKDNPEEDFSVNIESYLFQPESLKKSVPGAYDWIRQRFGDKFRISTGGAHG